jgi:hypothetical protein
VKKILGQDASVTRASQSRNNSAGSRGTNNSRSFLENWKRSPLPNRRLSNAGRRRRVDHARAATFHGESGDSWRQRQGRDPVCTRSDQLVRALGPHLTRHPPIPVCVDSWEWDELGLAPAPETGNYWAPQMQQRESPTTSSNRCRLDPAASQTSLSAWSRAPVGRCALSSLGVSPGTQPALQCSEPRTCHVLLTDWAVIAGNA